MNEAFVFSLGGSLDMVLFGRLRPKRESGKIMADEFETDNVTKLGETRTVVRLARVSQLS